MLEFFATNAPNQHHWTLNSCFCAFLSVRMHLGLFCYCTKLAAKFAKLVQLMQKFVPRCLARIFCNEHSRSTILHPKLMFWCVSFRFGPFGTVLLLHETWCKTSKAGAINAKVRAKLLQLMQKFVPRCLVRIFRNERSRSTPLDPKLMLLCISFRSRAYGTVLLLHETCCKTRQTGPTNAKVRATKSC